MNDGELKQMVDLTSFLIILQLYIRRATMNYGTQTSEWIR